MRRSAFVALLPPISSPPAPPGRTRLRLLPLLLRSLELARASSAPPRPCLLLVIWSMITSRIAHALTGAWRLSASAELGVSCLSCWGSGAERTSERAGAAERNQNIRIRKRNNRKIVSFATCWVVHLPLKTWPKPPWLSSIFARDAFAGGEDGSPSPVERCLPETYHRSSCFTSLALCLNSRSSSSSNSISTRDLRTLSIRSSKILCTSPLASLLMYFRPFATLAIWRCCLAPFLFFLLFFALLPNLIISQ